MPSPRPPDIPVDLPPITFLPSPRPPRARQYSQPQRSNSKDVRHNSKKSQDNKRPPSPTQSMAVARQAFLSLLLWLGSFLALLSLGLDLTALIYNVWLEVPSSRGALFVVQTGGKSTEQYIVLSVAVCIGGLGLFCLITILGAAYNHNLSVKSGWAVWFKFIAVAAVVVMTALGYESVVLAESPDSTSMETYGAGEVYARMALEYGIIGAVLLIVHEILFRLFLFLRLKKYGVNLAEERALRLSKRLRLDKDLLSAKQLRILVALILFFYYIQAWGLIYTVVEGWDLRVAIEFIVVTFVPSAQHACTMCCFEL